MDWQNFSGGEVEDLYRDSEVLSRMLTAKNNIPFMMIIVNSIASKT